MEDKDVEIYLHLKIGLSWNFSLRRSHLIKDLMQQWVSLQAVGMSNLWQAHTAKREAWSEQIERGF